MHSLNDNSKLNLLHMGRSHFSKTHSNKLNFQNPSIYRITSTNLANPPKIISKFKTSFHAAISSNRLQTQIKQNIKHYSVQCFEPNLFPSYLSHNPVDHLARSDQH